MQSRHYPRGGEDRPEGKFMAVQALSKSARLRALIKQDGILVAPGAYDCISARTSGRASKPSRNSGDEMCAEM